MKDTAIDLDSYRSAQQRPPNQKNLSDAKKKRIAQAILISVLTTAIVAIIPLSKYPGAARALFPPGPQVANNDEDGLRDDVGKVERMRDDPSQGRKFIRSMSLKSHTSWKHKAIPESREANLTSFRMTCK